MSEKKLKLAGSQRELLALKLQKRQEVIDFWNQQLQATLDMIARELGIPENELGLWKLDKKITTIYTREPHDGF